MNEAFTIICTGLVPGNGKALYVLTRLCITRGFQDARTSHASEDIRPSAPLAVPFRYQRN
jgi:hypothetical protein